MTIPSLKNEFEVNSAIFTCYGFSRTKISSLLPELLTSGKSEVSSGKSEVSSGNSDL